MALSLTGFTLWLALAGGDPAAGPPRPLIALDAGHGGEQTGAVGVCGVREKDVTLAVVQEVARILRESGRADVVLTRERDETVALEDRAQRANAAGAELFVSVHANASPDDTSRGPESFFLSAQAADRRVARLAAIENEGAKTRGRSRGTLGRILDSLRLSSAHAESQRLAMLVQESLNQRFPTRGRRVLQAPFVVLRYADMPAVLIEIGFLTNAAECRELGTLAFQRQVAQSIAAAALAHSWTRSLAEAQASTR